MYLRRCIYILDHHCFFLAGCVGRRNQKYFLVFCFYAALGCGLGVYHVLWRLSLARHLLSSEAPFYFFPFSLGSYITIKDH